MVVSNTFYVPPGIQFDEYFSDGLKPPTRNERTLRGHFFGHEMTTGKLNNVFFGGIWSTETVSVFKLGKTLLMGFRRKIMLEIYIQQGIFLAFFFQTKKYGGGKGIFCGPHHCHRC